MKPLLISASMQSANVCENVDGISFRLTHYSTLLQEEIDKHADWNLEITCRTAEGIYD